MKWFAGAAVLVVLVVGTMIAIDVTATPPPVAPGSCVFQNNLVLPDRCLSSCSSGADCPTARTRPYLVFWTEAAACPDAVICGLTLSSPSQRPTGDRR